MKVGCKVWIARCLLALLSGTLLVCLLPFPATSGLAEPPKSSHSSSQKFTGQQVPYYGEPEYTGTGPEQLTEMAFQPRDRYGNMKGASNVAVAIVPAPPNLNTAELKNNEAIQEELLDIGDLYSIQPSIFKALHAAGVEKLLKITVANIPKELSDDENASKGKHSEGLFLDELDRLKAREVLDNLKVAGGKKGVLFSDHSPCEETCSPMLPDSLDVYYAVPHKKSLRERDIENRKLEKKLRQAQEEKSRIFTAGCEPGKPVAAIKQLIGSAQTTALAAGPCGEANAGAVAPAKISGALSNELTKTDPSAPGGVDLSSLELRYIADTSSGNNASLRYAFQASPATGPEDQNAGLEAVQSASDAFFVWLTLPTSKFWVNLNPNEPDRIIDSDFGRTDAGRVLLEADLNMKKTVARLIHPDTPLGDKFQSQLIGSCFSSRQWIVPAPATVHEDGNQLYILDAPLEVKMESDYLHSSSSLGCSQSNQILSIPRFQGGEKESPPPPPPPEQAPQLVAGLHNDLVYRSLILPRVQDAVNKDPEFAQLRRVYLSRIAAEWYRKLSLRSHTAYGKLVDAGNISPWASRQAWKPKDTFDQYVRSFNEGEFKVAHQNAGKIETITFGGVDFQDVPQENLSDTLFRKRWPKQSSQVEQALQQPTQDSQAKKIWLAGITVSPISSQTSSGNSGWPHWIWTILIAVGIGFLLLLGRFGRSR